MFFLNEKATVFLDKCEGSTLRSFLDLRLHGSAGRPSAKTAKYPGR